MPTLVILRNCIAETGRDPWQAGQTVTASDSYARLLIGRGDAYDPSGGIVDIGVSAQQLSDAIDTPARSAQFGVTQRLLAPTRRLLANATGALWRSPCILTGIECVENGSGGTFSLDDALAADANNRIATGANTAATDGTQYPMVGEDGCLLINSGLYWTNTTGGVWWLDIIDGTPLDGVEQSGTVCAYARISASGIALAGPAWVHSIRIVAPGSSGSLVMYHDAAATSGRELRITAGYAFGSLTANQLIPIGAYLDRGLYLTMPTAGVVCVNYLPR